MDAPLLEALLLEALLLEALLLEALPAPARNEFAAPAMAAAACMALRDDVVTPASNTGRELLACANDRRGFGGRGSLNSSNLQ